MNILATLLLPVKERARFLLEFQLRAKKVKEVSSSVPVRSGTSAFCSYTGLKMWDLLFGCARGCRSASL
jgi:hypothetical protein